MKKHTNKVKIKRHLKG